MASTPHGSPLERVLSFLDGLRPTDRALPNVRAYLDAMLGMEPPPADVAIETIDLGGVATDLLTPATVVTGTTTTAYASEALLYLHGGGYCFGSRAGYRPLTARFAKGFAGQTYVPDYRLAPEHPYPAAIEDVLATWHALVTRVGDAKKIVVAGDSAGAGLALALMQKLRAAKEPLPRAAAFLSPWVDIVGSGASMETRAHLDPIVAKEKMAGMAQMYLGDGDRHDPLVSAVYADLHGFSPMVIHMGEREVEHDDIAHFVDLARKAGVAVDFKVWPGAIHVFQMFPVFPESAESVAEMTAFLRAQLKEIASPGIPGAVRG